MYGELTKLEKALLTIDFFRDERILTKNEAEDIKAYLSGKGTLIEENEDFYIDESECPL